MRNINEDLRLEILELNQKLQKTEQRIEYLNSFMKVFARHISDSEDKNRSFIDRFRFKKKKTLLEEVENLYRPKDFVLNDF